MKSFTTLLLLFLSTQFLAGQALSDLYQGELKVPGLSLKMKLHFTQEGDAWVGKLDIPAQKIDGMGLVDLSVSEDEVSFKLPDQIPGSASYMGKLSEDAQEITGKFTQGGRSFDLNFTGRNAADEARELAAVERIKQLADSLVKEHNIPGMGFGIFKDGKVILSEGFGYRDYENKIEVDDQTLFAIGSSSKAFTATGVAMLQDESLIEWDEPVNQYLKDFEMYDPFASQEMNPLDLLTHRSGLPRHDLMWYGSSASRQELFQKLKYLEPTKGFRTTFQYQNLMYMTAGVLIEEMSGQTWEDFTRDRIFKPLGMTSSNTSIAAIQEAENHALPYRIVNDTIKKMEFRNIDAIGPAGSINSNVVDMLKWVELNLGRGTFNDNELVSDAQYNVLHEGQMVITGPMASRAQPEYSSYTYGGGWFIYDYNGTKVVQHGGNIDGFSGYVYLLPDENIGMVTLINANGNPLGGVITSYATDILLGNEKIEWADRIWPPEDEEEEEEENEDSPDDEEEETDEAQIQGTNPSHDFTEYVGTYQHNGYGKVMVSIVDNQLRAKYNSFDMPLSHFHFDVFEGQLIEGEPDAKLKIQFINDVEGSIQKLEIALEASVDPIVFKKEAPDQIEDPKYIAKISGKYDVNGMKINVLSESGKLFIDVAGQGRFELLSYKKDQFQPKDMPGFSIKFKFENDRANKIVLLQPNGTFSGERIE